MSIGEKLRLLRLKMKRTLQEQSGVFGVSLNSLYRWEHDITLPKTHMLERMANFYNAPIDWLMQNSFAVDYKFDENSPEQQLFSMFENLSESCKHKVLGYVERVCVENMAKAQ